MLYNALLPEEGDQRKSDLSDNGGNFVIGVKELHKAVQEWNQGQIHELLL